MAAQGCSHFKDREACQPYKCNIRKENKACITSGGKQKIKTPVKKMIIMQSKGNPTKE